MDFEYSTPEGRRSMRWFRYSEVVDLSSDRKSLLFDLEDGLVLIDEVEAGLHPWVQQLLMLQLQKLALQNNLQVIVTSHSPIVLNAVPETGRIFLERDETDRVSVVSAYRDIVQNALYGRPAHTLNVLCEDARKIRKAAGREVPVYFLPCLHWCRGATARQHHSSSDSGSDGRRQRLAQEGLRRRRHRGRPRARWSLCEALPSAIATATPNGRLADSWHVCGTMAYPIVHGTCVDLWQLRRFMA